MKIKQLAERMGVSVQQLDVELQVPCNSCKKMGGNIEPRGSGCDSEKCKLRVTVEVSE